MSARLLAALQNHARSLLQPRPAMTVREILKMGDPRLLRIAKPVEQFDTPEMKELIADMFETMKHANGAGLAAPQIGLLRRLFVYQADDETGAVTVVNPEILVAGEEKEVGEEGCLSLALLLDEGYHVPVERSLRLTLRSQDVAGTVTEREISGYEARVVQHELDHLDGVLILDRATTEGRREAMRLLRGALT